MSLKLRTRSAVIWSLIEQIGARGLGTVFMLVFARFVSVEEFGIFAVITVMSGVLTQVAVFGLDKAVIQRPDLSRIALSTAFWFSLFFAGVISSVLIGFSGILARGFGLDELRGYFPLVSLSIFANSMGSFLTAYLMRDLNMKALARRTLLANALSGLLALPLVLFGYGLIGLVVQFVGGSLFTLIFTILLVGFPIRWEFDFAELRPLFRFGIPVFGADILTRYNAESPKLLVGFFLGVEALGILAMALRIMLLMVDLFGTTINRVVLPMMSQINRESPGRMGEIFLRCVTISAAILFPFFVIVAILSEPLVLALLGDNWVSVAPIASILCFSGLISVLGMLNGSVLLATGQSGVRFWITVARAIVGTILLLCLVPFGLIPTAFAFLIRSVCVEPLQIVVILRYVNCKVPNYLSSLFAPVLGAVSMACGIFAFVFLFSDYWNKYVIAFISAVLGLAIYSALLLLVRPQIFLELRQVIVSRGDSKSPK